MAIKFYLCPDGLEEPIGRFRAKDPEHLLPLDGASGLALRRLCRVRSNVASISQRFAEIYSIAARDRAAAEALDAQTKPEPQEILDMYAASSGFVVEGPGGWVWLAPMD